MATYRINHKTYKVGPPTNILEKFTCEHILFHSKFIEKNKNQIAHIKDMANLGIDINVKNIPFHERQIKWHEKHLEKYCKDYQRGF